MSIFSDKIVQKVNFGENWRNPNPNFFILIRIRTARVGKSPPRGKSFVPRSLSILLAQVGSMLTIRVHIFASHPSDDCSDVPVGRGLFFRVKWKSLKAQNASDFYILIILKTTHLTISFLFFQKIPILVHHQVQH